MKLPAALALVAFLPCIAAAEQLLITENNRLLRLDLENLAAGPSVLVENASRGGEAGRDMNGMICALPDGSGQFLAGEDTGQPDTRPGWGVFSAEGRQVAKLAGTYQVAQAEPHGCAFDPQGRLFTSSVGNQGFGSGKGQLFLWFPPYAGHPGPPGAYPATGAASDGFCKLATDISAAGGLAIDEAGRVYLASAGRGVIERFSPPFPTGTDAAGGCGGQGPAGSPFATQLQRETFADGWYTFSGLAFAPNGHLFASSVFTGEIVEYDADGTLLRKILDPDDWLPPFETGTPMGLALGSDGTLYYADLDLTWDFPSIGPGPDGKVWRLRFDEDGTPLPPEILLRGLAFPDGVAAITTTRRRAPLLPHFRAFPGAFDEQPVRAPFQGLRPHRGGGSLVSALGRCRHLPSRGSRYP
ncbi:MAG: hypothetical protein JRG95_15490 [Deltaproteobacteria bacterium]|nr:hypothetical protein [Deltaproteobacteria bacterium]